jgi:hypothetical protein
LTCNRQNVSKKQNRITSGIEHTDADNVELESSLQQLLLDLLRDAVETNMASREDSVSFRHRRGHDGLESVAENVGLLNED